MTEQIMSKFSPVSEMAVGVKIDKSKSTEATVTVFLSPPETSDSMEEADK
jgi:hypothetical protein